MNNKDNEQFEGNLDAQIAYWGMPSALTESLEIILKKSPIKRDYAGYFIDLGNNGLFLAALDMEEYLQWLERAYPKKAKEIRERVREADEHYFGRNYEAM